MANILYCKNCVLPNTRPNLYLDKVSKLCSVCKPIINKKKINWKKRAKEFELLTRKNIKKKK